MAQETNELWQKAEQVLKAAVADLEQAGRQGLREVRADLGRARRLGNPDPEATESAAWAMVEQLGPPGVLVSTHSVFSEVAAKPKAPQAVVTTLEVLGHCFLLVPGARIATLLGRCFIGAGFTRDAFAVLNRRADGKHVWPPVKKKE